MKNRHAAVLATLLLATGNASTADTGELWEVSTVMNVPGMPAGMGSQKSQVCRDKDAPAGPPRSDCKISNHKRSGLTESMTVSCPRQDTMQVEMTYNAARTEYKGTMKSADMVINTSGRKLGACDPQVAQRQRDEKTAKMQAQGKAAQAEGARVMAQSRQQQLDGLKKECGEAVSVMDYQKLAMPLCYGKNASMQAHCRSDVNMDAKSREMVMPAEGKAFCETKRTEFCRNLQTEAGFTKAANAENRTAHEDSEGRRRALPAAERISASSQFCGLKKEAVTAGLCSKALEGESWRFLGAYCPAQAKPVYTKNCAGRDYTSLYESKDKKLFNLCSALAVAADEATDGRPRTAADSQKKAAATPTTTESAAQQGINKIKGLFGR